MTKRVMTDQEFWQMFKYNNDPTWTNDQEGELYLGNYYLSGKATQWLALEIAALNINEIPREYHCEATAAILESGETMGLICWSQVNGARYYQATDRLKNSWEHLYPDTNPDDQFVFDPKQPDSIVRLDGWMSSFVSEVHRAAAINRDFEPGRVLLNHRFSILPQLEAGDWVDVSREPKGATRLTFTNKSVEIMLEAGALPRRELEKFLCKRSDAFGYSHSILSCDQLPPIISVSSITKALHSLGTSMGFCHLGLLKHKAVVFERATFRITASGEKAGLGVAGSDYP